MHLTAGEQVAHQHEFGRRVDQIGDPLPVNVNANDMHARHSLLLLLLLEEQLLLLLLYLLKLLQLRVQRYGLKLRRLEMRDLRGRGRWGTNDCILTAVD